MTTAPKPEKLAPAGRAEVMNALIEATERLSAAGQPSSFTIRQIAEEAGVTTSLMYFYFKSKDEVVLATARSIAAEIDATLDPLEDASRIALAVSEALRQRPAFPRLLAWLVLEGRGLTDLSDDPVLARMLTAFDLGGSSDPATDAATAATLLLGSALFGRAMNEAIQRPPDDERLLHALDRGIDTASATGT